MTKTRAFLSRVTLLRTNLSPLPIPLLPGFRGRWMTQDLGSSGPGLFVVFCLLEKKKKKSFCYLVFDSDDSFLFYSGPDFYKLFRMSYVRGYRVRDLVSSPSPSTPFQILPPSPTVCQTLNLLHLPPRPPTRAMNTAPKLLGWGE